MRSRTLVATLITSSVLLAPFLLATGAQADCPVTSVVSGCPSPPPTTTPPTTPPTAPPPTIPTPPTVPGSNPPPQPQPNPCSAKQDTAAAANRLLQLLNRDRLAAGLTALTRRADVDAIAVKHSGDMAAKNQMWHNDDYFTPASHDRLNAKTLGENVAMNPDIDDMHQRLMNSPHHRANILDPRFRQIGVGVVQSADGNLFATEDFLEPRAAVVAPAPAAATPRTPARTATAPVAAAAVAADVPVVALPVADDRLPWAGQVGLRTRPTSHGRSRTATIGFALLSMATLGGVGKVGLGMKHSIH